MNRIKKIGAVIVITILNISKNCSTSGTEGNLSNDVSIFNNIVTEKDENNVYEDVEEMDFNSEIVNSLNPFTGAFPTESLAYITKLRNIDKQNINNDFILKYAFSKVTKEDCPFVIIKELI